MMVGAQICKFGLTILTRVLTKFFMSALTSYYRSIKSEKLFTAIATRRSIPEPGAGDILYSLLDAAVAALAVRMYRQRKMLREQVCLLCTERNVWEIASWLTCFFVGSPLPQAVTILTSVVVLSLVSLFFHVAIARAIGMASTDGLAMGPR